MTESFGYAPRVSLSYDELSKVIPLWADRCDQMAVFEHPADKKTSRTHVHILILKSNIKAEQLKRIFRATYPGVDANGQKFWKWESEYGSPDLEFLKYCSKGELKPKFLKNITPEFAEEKRKQWMFWKPVSDIPDLPVKKEKYDEYEVLKKQFFNEHDDNMLVRMEFEEVRKWVFHWYYTRDGRIPHASCYKRNAGSLNLARGEKIKKFEKCSDEVFNLWY